MRRILIVEDDDALAVALRASFSREGFVCTVGVSGTEGLRLASEGAFDVILLDILLPGLNGRDVCAHLRRLLPGVPLLIITALGHELDVVAGFHAGADDYVVKPFGFGELLARVEAVMRRRTAEQRPPRYARFEDVLVDFESWTLTKSGHPRSLSPRDYEVLRYLFGRSGHVVSREELRPLVDAEDRASTGRLLDTYVWRIRRAIEDDPTNPQLLMTVRGRGYLFRPRVAWHEGVPPGTRDATRPQDAAGPMTSLVAIPRSTTC